MSFQVKNQEVGKSSNICSFAPIKNLVGVLVLSLLPPRLIHAAPSSANSSDKKAVQRIQLDANLIPINRISNGINFLYAVPFTGSGEAPTWGTQVPNQPGNSYGFILKVMNPEIRKLKLKVVIKSPGPTTWNKTDPNGKKTTTVTDTFVDEEEHVLEKGKTGYHWEIGQNEPSGIYEVSMYHKDVLILKIKFNLKETVTSTVSK